MVLQYRTHTFVTELQLGLNTQVYVRIFEFLPALGCVESPDNRLKSSKAEAAEVGAEETEEVVLLAAGGADGPEIREQPRRESSVWRWSESQRSTGKRVKYKEDNDTI